MRYSCFTLNSPFAGAIGAMSRSGGETSRAWFACGSSVRWPTGRPSNPCWPSSAIAPDESSAPASATSAAETTTAAMRRRVTRFLMCSPLETWLAPRSVRRSEGIFYPQSDMPWTVKLGLGALVAVAAAALAVTAALGRPQLADCAGGQLAGRFAVVPGSGAAGSISYALTLKNTSAIPCTVTGLPLGRLLGRRKAPLPTHVRAAHPGALTAVLVTLVPGDSTFASARFSP